MTQGLTTLLDLPSSDTNVSRAAETYAQLGFAVVQLHGVKNGRCTCGSLNCDRSTGKHPVRDNWQRHASADVDVVREYFRNHQGNVGIMLGDRYVALDVDGEAGFESLATLGPLPDTLTSRSGSGVGQHLIYAYAPHQSPAEVSNRKVLPGLDVKTRNGQVVVAPSLHASGKQYEWINTSQPAYLPDHVYQAIKTPARAPIAPQAAPIDSADRLYERAVAYVDKIDSAISGSDGHKQTFACARALAGFVEAGLPQSDAWGIFVQYNSRCVPPWDEHDLKHKWDDALRANTKPRIENRPHLRAVDSAPRAPAAAGGQPAPRQAPNWQEHLLFETTRHGMRLRKHHENAIVVLKHHPQWAGKIAFDTHAQSVTVDDPPWHATDAPAERQERQPWTDQDTARLSAWLMRELTLDISTSDCDKAVFVAAESRPYHPVREWMERLAWDGVPRLEQAAESYFGAEPSLFATRVFKWWLVAGVARTFEPGCKADNVLILEGTQGLRKSSALKALAGAKWFSDTPLDLQSKDAYLSIQGKLIVELAELESLRRADASRAKSFFTSASDTFRPPYGRRNVTIPRGCIFAGTVNHAAYLQDTTGNRRYWPVACSKVELDKIREDREQLWAEAVTLYHDGAVWWPSTQEEIEACEVTQEPRQEGDAWEPLVLSYLDTHQVPVTMGDVLGTVLGLEKAKWDRGAQMRVSAILQRAGRERRHRHHGGRRQWVYVGSESEDTVGSGIL